jgi:hypothetical protein
MRERERPPGRCSEADEWVTYWSKNNMFCTIVVVFVVRRCRGAGGS